MNQLRMESARAFAEIVTNQSSITYFYLPTASLKDSVFYDPICPDFVSQILYSRQLTNALEDIAEGKTHHIIAAFGIHFLLCRLPDGEGFFGMGPLRYKHAGKAELQQYLQGYHLPQNCLYPLNQYLESITSEHASSKPLEYVMTHIYHTLSANYDRSSEIPRIYLDMLPPDASPPEIPDAPNVREFNILHSQDAVLRELVAQGKRRDAGIVLESYPHPTYFYQANLNAFYRLLSLNITYKQALIESGANPGQTEQLYHTYLQKTAEDIGRLDNSFSKWSAKMLDDYCRLAREQTHENVSHLIRKAIDYILLNYSHSLTVPIIADHLNLTPTYLSSLFKKETGMTLTAYISKVRVESSLTLLRNTNLPIHEISEAVGFHDYNYFTRVFSNICGTSPTQYRKTKSTKHK